MPQTQVQNSAANPPATALDPRHSESALDRDSTNSTDDYAVPPEFVE